MRLFYEACDALTDYAFEYDFGWVGTEMIAYATHIVWQLHPEISMLSVLECVIEAYDSLASEQSWGDEYDDEDYSVCVSDGMRASLVDALEYAESGAPIEDYAGSEDLVVLLFRQGAGALEESHGNAV